MEVQLQISFDIAPAAGQPLTVTRHRQCQRNRWRSIGRYFGRTGNGRNTAI